MQMIVGESPSNEDPADDSKSLALRDFDKLTSWYSFQGSRARQGHHLIEVLVILVGASVSVVALALPGNAIPVATLGGVVVVLTGLRQLFHWHENYVRFTAACQALKQERRKYMVGEPPYDDPTMRDRHLIQVMNNIEAKETQGWTQLMASKAPEGE